MLILGIRVVTASDDLFLSGQIDQVDHPLLS